MWTEVDDEGWTGFKEFLFYSEEIFVTCFVDLHCSHLSTEAVTLLRALGGHNFCNATNFTSHYRTITGLGFNFRPSEMVGLIQFLSANRFLHNSSAVYSIWNLRFRNEIIHCIIYCVYWRVHFAEIRFSFHELFRDIY